MKKRLFDVEVWWNTDKNWGTIYAHSEKWEKMVMHQDASQIYSALLNTYQDRDKFDVEFSPFLCENTVGVTATYYARSRSPVQSENVRIILEGES